MKVSILIPLFNEQNTIIKILNKINFEIKSLKNFDFEIIVINDGSKDNSLILLQENSELYSKLIFMTKIMVRAMH